MSFYIDDGLADSYFLRQGRQAFFVRFGGIEFERIRGIKRRVALDPAGIHQKVDAIVGGNLVVVVALWTDLQVPFEIFLPKRILAAVAFDPQPFRKNAALIRSFYRLLLALEPGHKWAIIAAAGALFRSRTGPTADLNHDCHLCPGAAINLQKLIWNIDGKISADCQTECLSRTLLSTNNKNRDAGGNAGTTGEGIRLLSMGVLYVYMRG